MNNVCHIIRLELVANNPVPGQYIIFLLAVEVDGKQVWKVLRVLDANIFRRRF
jgi:hypothetical protein